MTRYSKMNDATHCFMKTCGKKVTFMEKNTCVCSKCKHGFCTLHRLAEEHECPHNFKEDVNKEKFIKENKCVGEKLVKI
uniref:AN1-type domain-containing protein n=1 Tax=viral metagenome TaxID=1070528 RepID=A0A6C0IK38_9ZZZZ